MIGNRFNKIPTTLNLPNSHLVYLYQRKIYATPHGTGPVLALTRQIGMDNTIFRGGTKV